MTASLPRFVCRTATVCLLLGLLATVSRPVPGHAAPQLTFGAGGAGGSGTWDTTTLDWYNGASNVAWINGDSALFAGSAGGTVSIFGTVTASQVTFATAGYTLQNFFLDGASSGLTVETDADATISSSIFGASSGNTAFTKTGSGALILPASGPYFFGTISIASGELRYSGAASTTEGLVPYLFADVAGVALTLGSTNNDVGSLSGGGVNGGVVRPNITSGNVSFIIDGSNNASFGGTIQDNGSATINFQKNGTSIQTLTGANTYSGATTTSGGTLVLAGASGSALKTASVSVSTGGTFLLDNSATSNSQRLATNVPVNLSGGTFSLAGNATTATTQTVGALSFSRASAVNVTPAGSTAAQLVFSGGLTRQNSGTISFSDGGNITLMGLTNVNGIVGSYATVNGTDWATVDTNAHVSAYTGYTSDPAASNVQSNLRLIAANGGTTSLGNTTNFFNSLNLANTGGSTATLDLGAGHTLALTSGGLLTSGTAGQVVQNGTLTASSKELVVTNQAALTISSTVVNSSAATALTKSGAGVLALTGMNTYTGVTTVVQGTVQVAADANLGAGSSVALSGGTLQATASFTSAKTLLGTGGTLDTGSYNVAFAGNPGAGYVTKAGTGMLSLNGVVNTVVVNSGTLRLTNLSANNTASVYCMLAGWKPAAAGVSNVVSSGTTTAEISPGSIGQAATLALGSLTVYGPTVVDFDLGSNAKDLITFSSSLNISSSPLLFRFTDLGGISVGTTYALANLYPYGFPVSVSQFAIDPMSTAAGFKGTFTLTNNVLSVTFSAVPEPGNYVWLLGGLVCGGFWQRARRSRTEKDLGNHHP